MFKAVIFDMDGTIIDSEPIYEKASQKIYKKYGLELTQADHDRYLGAKLEEIWEDILDRYQLKDKYAHYTIEKILDEHVQNSYDALARTDDLELIKGVESWFQYFKKEGYPMIIASSSYPSVVKHIYQRFNLKQYMEGFVDGKSVENGKPAPDIFIKAAAKMGVKAEECLIIEDSEKGVNAAQAAGAEVIAFNRAENPAQDLSEADLIIKEYNQENLKKILS